MVTVYNFELYDRSNGRMIIPRWKSTLEKIFENKEKIILETAQIVDGARIYGGSYIPVTELK